MSEEEEALICIDHRLHHDEPKVVIGIYGPFTGQNSYGLDEIPRKIKFSIHRMRGFDKVLREFRRPPSRWLNHWLRLEYLDRAHKYIEVPILFDDGGYPYVMAPAKLKPVTVKVMIREKDAEDILERLVTATDFCDHCSAPLKNTIKEYSAADDGLMYSSGGGTIASVFNCSFCERESIRWDATFLEEHPEMGELKTR